MIEETAGDSPL